MLHTLQGCKSRIFSLLPVVPGTLVGSSQSSSMPSSSKTSSSNKEGSSNEINQHIASEYENVELQHLSLLTKLLVSCV